MAIKLPKFKGVSSVKYEADILGGSFGRSVDREVQRLYGRYPVINCVRYSPKTKRVEGSTPFYAVATNEVIRPEGLRTMTVDDAKLIREIGFLDLSGNYVDCAGVARKLKGRNDYFTQKLLEGRKQKLPMTVNACDFDLVEDDKSEHGLVFRIRDDAQIILGDVAEFRGNASFDRLYLGGDLDLCSWDEDLAVSGSSGRVVVVSGEATAQNLNKYVKEFQEIQERNRAELSELRDRINQKIKTK